MKYARREPLPIGSTQNALWVSARPGFGTGAFVNEQIDRDLMVRTSAAQVNEIQPAECDTAKWRRVAADPAAQHVLDTLVMAVLIVDVKLRVRCPVRGHDFRVVFLFRDLPRIQAPRTPADAVECASVHVMHDAADMFVLSEDELGREGIRIDAVDVALAVRPIFRDRHPDVFPIVVDAAGVIFRAVGELDLAEKMAGGVELEQPAAPGARRR